MYFALFRSEAEITHDCSKHRTELETNVRDIYIYCTERKEINFHTPLTITSFLSEVHHGKIYVYDA